MRRLNHISERALLGLIIALFFAPLLATLPQARKATGALLRESRVSPDANPQPGRFFKQVEAFKKALTDKVNTGFIGRDWLIRWTSELWYRLFRTCAARSANIIIGNGDNLFENNYLYEYCLNRVGAEELEPLVDDLKRLQDICGNLGMSFVLVITPSKAAIYPEYIPATWLERYDSRPRGYDVLIPLLQSRGIHFVDGHALALREKEKAPPVPLYPKGGAHWGQLAAWLTANATLDRLSAQGQPVGPLLCKTFSQPERPGPEEYDLVQLMKLAVPWRYPTLKVEVQPCLNLPAKRPTLAVIGDSFMWRMLQQLSHSRQFAEIDAYFYYKLYKIANPEIEDIRPIVREPTGEVDFQREIYGADCLMLELNESAIPNPHFLKVFVKDALSHVPGNGIRGPFLYESYQPCAWGEELWFGKSHQPRIRETSLWGFCKAGNDSTWTRGPVATLQFSVPPAKGDLVLKANVGALVDPAKLPRQSAKIFVNDLPAGEWVFSDEKPGWRELPLRKEWLAGKPHLVLRFEISHPASPRSLGMGRERQEVGLHFISLVIAEKPADLGTSAANAAEPAAEKRQAF